jgi:hypothetical protein
MGTSMTPEMAVDDLYKLSGIQRDDNNLNDEFPIEGVTHLHDFYLPFDYGTDFADISANIGTITALENRIADLLYLADDIQNASGMNQSFAMEAEKLLPGFGKVPLGYYTLDTSATRYKVSLEEISKGIWALIAAAAAALAAVVYKFIKWLFGDKDDKGKLPTADAINALRAEVKECSEKISELNNLLRNSPELKEAIFEAKRPLDANATAEDKKAAEDTKKCLNAMHVGLDDFIAAYIEKEGKGCNLAKAMVIEDGLVSDILNKGTYFKVMLEAKGKCNALKSSTESVTNSVTHAVKNIININNVDFIPLESARPIVNKFDGERKVSAGDIVNKIIAAKNVAQERSIGNKIVFTELDRVFGDLLTSIGLETTLREILALREVILKLGKTLDEGNAELSKIDIQKDYPTLVAEANRLKVVIHSAKIEVSELFKFLQEMNAYAQLLIHVQRDVIGKITTEVMLAVKREVDAGGVMSPEINDAINKLKNRGYKLEE